MAEPNAAAKPHEDSKPQGRKGKREKQKYRGGKSMVIRFLLAMVVLSGVRIVIDLKIFFTMPSGYTTALLVVPSLLCAVFFLNASLPEHAFRGGSYVLMLLLLIPIVVFCDYARTNLNTLFYGILKEYDILSLQTLFINALPSLLLNTVIMIAFIVLWRAAFTGGLRMQTRWWSMLNPVLWIVSYIGCVLVSYCTVLLSEMNRSDPYAQALFGPVKEVPVWYDITVVGNLVVEYAQQPLAIFTLGFMLLWAMRMLRRGYMESLITPPPPSPAKPSYMEGRPSAAPQAEAPAGTTSPPPAAKTPALAATPPTNPTPSYQMPPRQTFSQESAKTDEKRGPQRPL